MNNVDTSPETIEREWSRIENEHKVQPEAPETDPEPPQDDQPTPEQVNEEKRILTQVMLSQSIRTMTQAFAKVDLPADVFQDLGSAYTDLVLKYFPNMGLFGLWEKYKVEVTAVTASAGFIFALREARAEKRRELMKQQAANDETMTQERAA